MNFDSVDHFLNRAARIPLLTPDEEITLARSIQQMLAIQEAKPNGRFTKVERAAIKRGKRARDRFVTANLRLVANVAGKYFRALHSSMDIPQEDLIQEGMLGLMRAVEKFDCERGYKFSTYAYWWIRQAIIRGMQVNGRTIRLPVHIHERLYALNQHRHQLRLTLGRYPTNDELADAMGWDREFLEQVIIVSGRQASLDATVGEEETATLRDAVSDGIGAEEQLEQISDGIDRARLHQALCKLSPAQRQMIEMRFGFNGTEPTTLTQIGNEFNITREAVRMNIKRASQKLRTMLSEDPQFRLSKEWLDGRIAA